MTNKKCDMRTSLDTVVIVSLKESQWALILECLREIIEYEEYTDEYRSKAITIQYEILSAMQVDGNGLSLVEREGDVANDI